ncbi:MAG: 3'(2'),5'-bisphosphate nucleotidase CysQ, partial [Tateyamaria sp.]|nr:3'(2'),5'-bisphosphate nucleotidase CysQ [Tateyamaria sp.]
MNYDLMIPVMRRLALQAGEEIMEIYGKDDFAVKLK